MKTVKRLLPFVVIALVFLALAVTIGPTLAQQPETHCISWIEPVKPGERESRISPPTCYDNFADVIAHATGGQLQLPRDITPLEAHKALEQFDAARKHATNASDRKSVV